MRATIRMASCPATRSLPIFDAPVREGVNALSARKDGARLLIETSDGEYASDSLVLATGAFQRPHRPAAAASLPSRLHAIDLDGYTNSDALPPGDALLIGSGQSGCQFAEELHQAGRRVVLACGRAPWFTRRVGDHDLVWWLLESGFLDARAEGLPKEARLFANILATGHEGGHDLHLRVLRDIGVTLVGRFVGVEGETAQFADNLGESVQWGDDRFAQLKSVFLKLAEERGIDLEIPDPEPFDSRSPGEIDLSPFGTVLFTGGFRPDFRSWLPWDDAFDDGGGRSKATARVRWCPDFTLSGSASYANGNRHYLPVSARTPRSSPTQ
jgi:putative flavoprotein involved in K+ transport